MSRSRATAWAVIGAGLAARLAHLAFIKRHPFYELHTVWDNSDMHQFLAWARHLAGGDWLDASTFRPFFGWQEAIAPREVWNSWFGAHVYYQPPLYPYLLAAALAATGSLDLSRIFQIALGAINCGLIAMLGARLYGPPIAWIAGLGAALYAPFIVYDAEILRGTVVMTTQLLLLLALAAGHDGRSYPGWGRAALLSGVAFGISYLADPAILLFALLALIWIGWSASHAGAARASHASRALLLFAAGAVAALLPLMARNVAVGAPALSSTTRGPLAFVMGNAPDAHPAGAFIPETTGSILRDSGYGMISTMSHTLRLYGGDTPRLATKQWEKMKALWGAYEVPDNPSFYYAARVSPVAAFGLRFLPVAAFGLVGLALALPAALRDPRHALLPLFLLASTALFLLAHVVSRYRQPMVAGLLILGAHAIALAWRKKGLWAIGIAGAAGALMFLLPWAPPEGYGYSRPAEFVMTARLFEVRGQINSAVAELTTAVEAARKEPVLRHHVALLLYECGMIQARADRHQEAVESFREALKEDSQYGEAAQALQASLQALRSHRPGLAP